MTAGKFYTESKVKNKSLLLDLDETLIHTFLCGSNINTLLEKLNNLGIYDDESLMSIQKRVYKINLLDPDTPSGTGEMYGCVGIFRPHCIEFLIHCFKNFNKVGIWSAGKKKYVHSIAKILESLTQFKFHVIYTYDDCEVNENGIIYKPIQKLLKNNPNFGHISKVFIIDDRKSTMKDNKDNGIIIKQYKPNISIKSLLEQDTELLKIINYFNSEKLDHHDDVRKLEKNY